MEAINPINYVTYDNTGKLTGAYFQQDEWQAFSVFIYEEIKGGIGNLLMLPILYGRGHFVPIIFLQAYLLASQQLSSF